MSPLTSSVSASSSYLRIRILITIIIFMGSSFFQFATTENGYDYCGYNNSANGYIFCGNGVTLQYPFWFKDEKEQQQRHYYCGYPGFGITCGPINSKPTINIYNQSYSVIQASNIFENEITIVDPYFILGIITCPTPYRNFTPDSSHSVFLNEVEDYNRQLTFFSNCNSTPPQITSNGAIVSSNQSPHVECLDHNDTKRSYVFVDLDLERERTLKNKLARWNQNHCMGESVIVPVAEVDEATDLKKTLGTGFRVRWATPIECQMCESSGGYCSYLETKSTYTCSCGGGRQLRHSADRKEHYYCSWDNDTLIADKLTLRADTSMHSKILIIGICSGFGGLASLMILLLFVYRNNQ